MNTIMIRIRHHPHRQYQYLYCSYYIKWIWFSGILTCLLMHIRWLSTIVTTHRNLWWWRLPSSSKTIQLLRVSQRNNNQFDVIEMDASIFQQQKQQDPSFTMMEQQSTQPHNNNRNNNTRKHPKHERQQLRRMSRQQQQQQQPKQTNSTIVLIHVGKTGGETIKQILSIGCQSMKHRDRKRHCQQQQQQQPSQLSNHVHGYYHCHRFITSKYIQQQQQIRIFATKATTRTTTLSPADAKASAVTASSQLFNIYLFTVRHPVDRIISWYNYVNPQHCEQKYHSYLHQYQYQHADHRVVLLHRNDHRKTDDSNTSRENTTTTTSSSSSSTNAGISCQTVHDMIRAPHGFAATFFMKCFPTLHDWSDALPQLFSSGSSIGSSSDAIVDDGTTVDNTTSINDDECIRLAQQSIRGDLESYDGEGGSGSRITIHLIANYKQYMDHTIGYDNNNTTKRRESKRIYVVRTEHLWDDLRNIDIQFLHGDGNFGNHTGTAITHSVTKRHDHKHSNNYNVYDASSAIVATANSSLSQQQHSTKQRSRSSMISTFCCALLDEIERYIYLIEHAHNLLPSQKQMTVQETIRYCINNNGDSTAIAANEDSTGNQKDATEIQTWNDLQHTCRAVSASK